MPCWGLGEVTWPNSVVSTGGKYAYIDDQETPNTQFTSFDYGGRQLQFEVRGLHTGGEGNMAKGYGNYVGNLFYGADGWMALDGEGFKVYKGDKEDLVMDVKREPGDETTSHMANFLTACRSRNYKDLHADVALGVIAADLCHLANASYRVGRKLALDPASGRFTGEGAAEANQLLTRPKYREPYVV